VTGELLSPAVLLLAYCNDGLRCLHCTSEPSWKFV